MEPTYLALYGFPLAGYFFVRIYSLMQASQAASWPSLILEITTNVRDFNTVDADRRDVAGKLVNFLLPSFRP